MDPTAQNYLEPRDRSVRNLVNNYVQFIRSHPKVFYPLFILLLVLFGAATLKTLFASPTRTATVVGVGKLKVKPEKAIVSFSVVQESFSQEDAIAKGEAVFTTILNTVNTYNPASVEKSEYQIVPKTPTVSSVTKSVNPNTYQYVNAAKITLDDLASVPQVVSSLYANNASAVSQVRYVTEDEEQTDRDVRILAVKNAREKAGDIARASGTRVGKVITIQEGGSTGQTGSSVTGTAQSDTENDNSPGEIELQSTVTVLYELY